MPIFNMTAGGLIGFQLKNDISTWPYFLMKHYTEQYQYDKFDDFIIRTSALVIFNMAPGGHL